MSCLCPSAIAAAATPGSSGTTNEPDTEMAKDAGKRFRVVVPCNNGAAWNLRRINAGQEKELSVPQRNYRGVELNPRAIKSGGSATIVDVFMTSLM